jgi:NAD(P)-dependent dehydrogenase (short-subunit alcohol dehydrogenase family)
MDFFKGKTAMVTGAVSGIGRAIAFAFADAGCDVIATDLIERMPEAAQHGRVHWRAMNVTDELDVSTLVGSAGEIHFLVNCAGIIMRDDEYRMPEFQQVIDVNLNGVMRISTAARPMLIASKGCIVNIASMLSFFGGPRVPAYSASKGAIVQLTKSLAVAWAADGIRVNAVAPGWIDTAFTQALRDDEKRSAEIIGRTPMKRWGRAEEVAGPVLFLCSPAADFITGAVLPIDGGYSVA